jgi:hypothetical protein
LAGEKKCMPTTSCGREVLAAISSIESVEAARTGGRTQDW